MSLPSIELVLDRISSVEDEQFRFCLIALYLLDTRISELVSRTYEGQNPAYGPRGIDARKDSWNNNDVAVFKLKTAKRQGRERYVALPLDKQFEPRSKSLLEYFLEKGENPVFPFTRQKIFRYMKLAKVFGGWTYPIETYKVSRDYAGQVERVQIPRHQKSFTLHALRHLRTTELVEYYGFDGFNLAAYGGWTVQSTIGISGMFDRYLSLNWQSYIGKLFKPRR